MTVTVGELPAVYLDGLSTEAAPARLLVANRNPEPNQTEVPGDQNLSVDVIDTGAIPGINLAATKVYVDGVLAYDGSAGGFQPGYLGVDSAVQSPAANVRRIVVDPTFVLDSQMVVTLRVVSETTDTLGAVDVSWDFTVADTTAPRVLTVEPRSPKVLRVAFSEPMDMSTALVGANYAFRGDPALPNLPAMPTTGASVVQVTSSVVEVTTKHELSFGRRYELTVSGAKDARGNVILAPYDRFVFTAVTPQRPLRRRFDLWKMVPAKNRREDTTGDLLKFILCLQDATDVLLYYIDKFADALDIDYAPEDVVDAMLADLGNPFTDFSLSLAEKRRLGRVLIDIYRQKGTAPGIVSVVNLFLGVTVTVIPYLGTYGMSLGESELGFDWELGIGTRAGRYSFDVQSAIVLTTDQRAKIRRIVNYMKSAHTHFINLLEPFTPVVVDHLVLGESELGSTGVGNEGTWDLH